MGKNVNVINILKMVIELKGNPHQTDKDIYTRLGFSRAAFYKYKKHLAEKMDFHFRYSRKHKCFLIDNDPFFPTLNLSLGELSSLVFSMSQLFASGGDYIVSYRALKAVQKLIAHCNDNNLRRQLADLLADGLHNQGHGCGEEILEKIEAARESQKFVHIRYYSIASAQEVEHQVAPYMIYFKRRALYMDAYSTGCERVLQFRMARIRKARILSYTAFEIRSDYNFHELHEHAFSVFGGKEAQKVRIRFSSAVAAMISEVLWHRSQKIVPDIQNPGGIIFEVRVAHPPEVMWWMRQWGAAAEVLEPKEMRAYVRDIAQRELALYTRS